jgi:thermitase
MKAARIIIALITALLFVGLGVPRVSLAAWLETPIQTTAISFDQTGVLEGAETSAKTEGEAEILKADAPDATYSDKHWGFGEVTALLTASTDAEVLIAILDTGIDEKHEDLAGKVVASINFSGSQTASDVNGHGTHVAGIIAAITDNSVGVAGIAPNARLLNVKVVDDNGVVWSSTVARGIIWAVDNGAKVINMSLVIPTSSPALEQAIDYAWSKGVVLVASGGNNIKSIPVYPAYYPEVIAVAATDVGGNLWSKSNYGDWVDAYAPGVDIYSTLPGNSYGYQSGTSMAAAYVAAVAALALTTVTDANGDGQVNDEVATLLKTLLALPR